MSSPFQVNRDHAVALHRNGQIEQAMLTYEELLKQQPDSADLLGLLGVANEQIGRLERAESLLRQSLGDRTSVPLAYRNLNNLLGLLIESGRLDEAKAAAETYLTGVWPSSRIPDAVEQGTIISLVSALKDAGLAGQALATGFPFLSTMGRDAHFALLIAQLLHEAGRNDEASAALDRDFGPGEELPNLHAVRAALAYKHDDLAGCKQASQRFAACMPVLLSEAEPSQQFVLAVFNRALDLVTDFQNPHQLHYNANFPSQLMQALADRFRFMSILADTTTVTEALSGMPHPALALNNVVNAEQLRVDDTLQRVSDLEDSLGVKVINHPRLAAQVTRQKNAERFANIPGLISPKVFRYHNDKTQRIVLIKDIESRCGYPVIIRTVFHQMGSGTWLIHKRDELADILDRLDVLQFYAIRYIQSRHRQGTFRALRAAFIDGQAMLIRADYSESWNVRARRNSRQQAFYAEHPQLLQLANATVSNPQAQLGQAIFDKLDAVARLMPLDIFGMDFDVTEGGDLLIFEANATMNLLSTSPEGLEYPPQAEERLQNTVERYFLSRVVGN